MKRSTSAIFLALAVVLGSGAGLVGGLWHEGADAQTQPSLQLQPQARQTLPALRPDQIRLLRDTLAVSADQGFADGEFFPSELDKMLQSPDAGRRAQGQALLMAQTVRYASALHRGRLANSAFDAEWGMRPAPFDAQAAFDQALIQNKLKTWLDDLSPPYLGYQQLVSGLKTYREIVARGGWRPITPGPAMKLGADDARVPALKARLAVEDPLVAKAFADADQAAAVAAQTGPGPNAAPDPLMFDAALDQGLKTFQTRHGLDPTGVVDKATLDALNTPAAERVQQILANMERWRWAPPVMPADRVQVNIAAAVLTLFRGEQPVLSMRAIAGRVADHTPILQSTIHSIVFNPPWNVPSTIAAKELWPKERAHPGYFKREDFAVIRTADGVRLQQRAGPKSALGQIKFDFDNHYGVYLHDTPNHTSFGRENRQASHGCVRLDQPKELAFQLLNDTPSWTPGGIDDIIAARDTKRVPLTRPTAVLIFYWTAFAGPDGAMNFRPDTYGWDRELMQRIAAGGSSKA